MSESYSNFVDPSQAATMKNRRMEIQIKKMKEKEQDEANYTGRPRINKSRKKPDTNENRFERLYKEAERKCNNPREFTDFDDSEKELTFQPKLATKGRSVSAGRARVTRNNESTSPNPNGIKKGFDEIKSSQRMGDIVTSDEVPGSGASVKSGPSSRPFTPTISKRAQRLTRETDEKTGEKVDVSEMLYSQGKMLSQKLQKLKDDVAQKTLEENTFAPKLVSRTKKDRSNCTTKYEDLTERMIRYEEFKNRRRTQAARSKEEHDQENLTFQPHICTTTKKRFHTPTDPIHKRLATFAENKKAIVNEVKKEMTADHMFQPDFSYKKRSSTPDSMRVRVSVDHEASGERMFKEAALKRETTDFKRKELKNEMEMDGCKFKPTLVSRSRSNSAQRSSRRSTTGVDAGERLYYEGKEYVDRRVEMWKQQKVNLEVEECSFKPEISKKGRNTVVGDAEIEISERLYDDHEKKQNKIKRLHEDITEQRNEEIWQKAKPFNPTLQTRSRSATQMRRNLAAQEDCADGDALEAMFLEAEKRRRQADDYRKWQQEEELGEACTFRPQISKLANAMPVRTKNGKEAKEVFERLCAGPDAIKEVIEAKCEEEIAERELAECTFTPTLETSYSKLTPQVRSSGTIPPPSPNKYHSTSKPTQVQADEPPPKAKVVTRKSLSSAKLAATALATGQGSATASSVQTPVSPIPATQDPSTAMPVGSPTSPSTPKKSPMAAIKGDTWKPTETWGSPPKPSISALASRSSSYDECTFQPKFETKDSKLSPKVPSTFASPPISPPTSPKPYPTTAEDVKLAEAITKVAISSPPTSPPTRPIQPAAATPDTAPSSAGVFALPSSPSGASPGAKSRLMQAYAKRLEANAKTPPPSMIPSPNDIANSALPTPPPPSASSRPVHPPSPPAKVLYDPDPTKPQRIDDPTKPQRIDVSGAQSTPPSTPVKANTTPHSRARSQYSRSSAGEDRSPAASLSDGSSVVSSSTNNSFDYDSEDQSPAASLSDGDDHDASHSEDSTVASFVDDAGNQDPRRSSNPKVIGGGNGHNSPLRSSKQEIRAALGDQALYGSQVMS